MIGRHDSRLKRLNLLEIISPLKNDYDANLHFECTLLKLLVFSYIVNFSKFQFCSLKFYLSIKFSAENVFAFNENIKKIKRFLSRILFK